MTRLLAILLLASLIAGQPALATPPQDDPMTVMTPATNVASRSDRRPVAGGIHDAVAQQTFITWGGRNQDNYIQAYDHRTARWSAPVLVGEGGGDSHNYPTIVQARDGHLLVFRGLHNRELVVARSERPHSIAGQWTNTVIEEGLGATYPMPFVTADGSIFVFIRETTHDFEPSVPTDTRPMKYARSTDNGHTWKNTEALTGTKYAIAPWARPDNMNEIYIGQIRYEPAGSGRPERIHFVYTLAGGGPEGNLHDRYHRNIYYTYFTPSDLRFHSASGVDVGVSIDDADQERHLKVVHTGLQMPNPRTPDYISLVGWSRNGKPFVIWMTLDPAGVLHTHHAEHVSPGRGWVATELGTNVRVRDMEPLGPHTWRVYATPAVGVDTHLLHQASWRYESSLDIPRAVGRIEVVGGFRDPVRILASGASSGRDVGLFHDGDIYTAGFDHGGSMAEY